jgi:hypothetical protein
MPRHLFGPDVFWTADTTTNPPTPRLAPDQAFTVWTNWTGGTDVTGDLLQTDLATPLAAVATSDGELPRFYGPDTTDGSEIVALYVSASGGTRYPLYADDMLREVLSNTTGDEATIAQQALDAANATADALANLNAVISMGAPMRIWPRTAAQGLPTPSEGVADDDYVFLDAS